MLESRPVSGVDMILECSFGESVCIIPIALLQGLVEMPLVFCA